MLKRPLPAAARRAAGAALVLALTFGAGLAAWAAQPPRMVLPDAPSRSLGRVSGLSLIEAIRDGDDVRAWALIKAGADVNAVVFGDGSPLIAAAREGRLDLVTALVERGARVGQAVPGDGDPLIAAAAGGYLDVVRYLVGRGANVNAEVHGDETPLINAARSGSLQIGRAHV